MKKYIYLEGFHAESVIPYLYSITLIAKYEATRYNNVLLLLTSRNYTRSKSIQKHFKSISKNIKVVFLKDYFSHPMVIIKSIFSSISIILGWKSILKYRLNKTLLGDLIYDSIIINSSLYTLNEFRFFFVRYIFVAMLEYYSYNIILNNHMPSKVFLSHLSYSRFGILARLSQIYTNQIYLTSHLYIRLKSMNFETLTETQPNNIYNVLKDISDKTNLSQSTKDYLNRINGDSDQIDAINSFSNKKVLSHKQLNRLFKFYDENKFIVLIASHVLSDAPHGNMSFLFKDYYDWLIFTLTELSKNESVEVIIKEHPSAYLYGENDLIEKILKSEFFASKVKMVPNEISTKSLIGYVDATITVAGTIGIEFACTGIPSIILGSPYYKGNGFTVEPISKTHYISILRRIHNIPKLNNLQIKLALLLFHKSNRTSIMIPEIFKKISKLHVDSSIYNSTELSFEDSISELNQITKHIQASQINLDDYISYFNDD